MRVPKQPPGESKRLDAALGSSPVPLYGEQEPEIIAIADFDPVDKELTRHFLRALGTIEDCGGGRKSRPGPS